MNEALTPEQQESQKLKERVNEQPVFEDHFPHLDRRHKGYFLEGFRGHVPIWRFKGWDIGKKYTGEKLRQLRAERGVGRPPKKVNNDSQGT